VLNIVLLSEKLPLSNADRVRNYRLDIKENNPEKYEESKQKSNER